MNEFPSRLLLLGWAFLGLLPAAARENAPTSVPVELFEARGGLEVTVWAQSPLFYNPTNIDIDRDGRIWVAEGYRYRLRDRPEGDRIVVLEDKDGDGKAESSHVFVQEPALVSPLGVAVLDDKIIVSQPPDMIVYTDVDRDLKFDPKVDKREVLLSGFSGINHDHSLHSVTAGPEGKWYFNAGNTGAKFTDRSGTTFRIAGAYRPTPIGPFKYPFDAADVAGRKSDDGHVYVGGFAARMNPDGTDVEIIGHNFRNSYEQSVTSFGDVFQNDNDDPPACRVAFLLEYGNAGFCSNDGQRTWMADRRPGQSIPMGEWRQDDPGIMPAGDVYGGGSPTGNAFYENGALGKEHEGTFLACEAGRNVVFGYQPVPEGAGFKLERFDFLTSNAAREFAGSDFLGGADSVTSETKTLFRPSDVAVGPDGAIYVSDWFDARVGGHQVLDEGALGTIYRVAPKGFRSQAPKFDLETTEGQVEALKSPAVNVRNLGFVRLRETGDAGIPAVTALLEDENRFIRARAIWLLTQMGDAGIRKVSSLMQHEDAQVRVAVYRALRRQDYNLLRLAARMAKDPSPAVRREVAVSMRNLPFAKSGPVLVEIAKRFDGEDRTYLEAFGIGATGVEAEVYAAVKKELGAAKPEEWTDAFGWIAWRLHPASAAADFAARAGSETVSPEQRRRAMDALAFIPSREAADFMMDLAQGGAPLKADAVWWVLNRTSNEWEEFDLMPELARRGIYDPSKVVLQEVIAPDPKSVPDNLPPVAEILAMKGDAARGKVAAQRCIMCHRIDGTGIELGPALDGWGRMQTREVIVNSIVNPSSGIAHGYDGTEIVTDDGKTIHGLLIKESNPFMITSMGGITQIVPGEKIASMKKLDRSLMLSAAQLALTAQEVADIVAYLKEN